VERIIVHRQHGAAGSTAKAGKGFDVADLVVSIASGTPWLGRFNCPNPGPVALYPGEEDGYEIRRRLVAVAEARGVNVYELPIHVAENTPRLSRPSDLDVLRVDLARVGPRIAIIDPMYKAAAGGDPRSVIAMGELLNEASDIARSLDCSFLTVPHFNRDTTRKGSDRFSGAGAQEWGRFLIAGTVTRRIETEHGGTEIVRRVEVTGTSIPDQAFVVTRRITATDQNDPNAPLVYEVQVSETDAPADFRPTVLMERISRFLESRDEPCSQRHIRERVTGKGAALLQALDLLVAEGYVEAFEGPRASRLHRSINRFRDEEETL
jgi:RecA-family ATPase